MTGTVTAFRPRGSQRGIGCASCEKPRRRAVLFALRGSRSEKNPASKCSEAGPA
jgi:hypothetical protein